MKKLQNIAGILLLSGTIAMAGVPESFVQRPSMEQSLLRESEFPIWIAQQRGHRPEGPPPGRGPRPGGPPPRRGSDGPPTEEGSSEDWDRPLPPPRVMERLRRLPPDERERVLRNNWRFQQLPKKRQDQLLDRMRRFQELSPNERERIEERFSVFRNLTPEQREKTRKVYEEYWSKLEPERRSAIVDEFRSLRELPEKEREKRLESEEIKNRFNQKELEVLKQLSKL